ncbi:MAG: flavodoxin family protein [Chloroflexi bacterium]|nr:flavodoxin family protein [Chloroflexota bacterium]
MKVLALNGSPKMEKSNTSLILEPFLDGMREAGAEVEIFYTKKLHVSPCQGDRSCSSRTPGECIQKDDDMAMLYPKLRQADVWAFASPVYWGGMTGPMKNLVDRMVPLLQPSAGQKQGLVVLVSNCGWWDLNFFDLLVAQVKAVSMGVGRRFAGSLLRPHGPALGPMKTRGAPVGDVLEAAKAAGVELVRDGKMSKETLDIVSRELLPREAYMRGGL